MKKLRDQMLADLQLSGATPRTQKTYLREAGNLAKYFNRSPADLGEGELKEYMLYLMQEMGSGTPLNNSISKGDDRYKEACFEIRSHKCPLTLNPPQFLKKVPG